MLINRADVYRYMGFQNSFPSLSVEKETDRLEELLLDTVTWHYVWRLFDLERSGDPLRLSGCGFELSGSGISQHLADCEKAAVIAVTLGIPAEKFLKNAALQDGLSGLCADALASALTESVLDEARNDVIKETGLFATWCFAPGYGDFPLETASKLISAVDAARTIGLSVTASGMLTPQKSIIGVVGLSEKKFFDKRRSCSDCDMNRSCRFRRSGDHCDRCC